MREIKFRGWHTSAKKMFSAEEMASDQLTLLTNGSCFINVNGKHTSMSTIYPNDKFIPMQYTGLKDNKGKEIYEGDIVERGVILFDNGKFQGYYYDSGGIAESWEDDLFQEKVINVIGNMYENPELLK